MKNLIFLFTIFSILNINSLSATNDADVVDDFFHPDKDDPQPSAS